MIFQPKFFFQKFSLNTEVRKCYINFGDLGGPRFYRQNETKIFFWLLIPSYNSPRAHFLIRKFWQNRRHATPYHMTPVGSPYTFQTSYKPHAMTPQDPHTLPNPHINCPYDPLESPYTSQTSYKRPLGSLYTSQTLYKRPRMTPVGSPYTSETLYEQPSMTPQGSHTLPKPHINDPIHFPNLIQTPPYDLLRSPYNSQTSF